MPTDPHNLGTFTSVASVWETYTTGGTEGDYVSINGVRYNWNVYEREWLPATVTIDTAAREVTEYDGDVYIQNDLTVAGYIRAKGIKQPCLGLFLSSTALSSAWPDPEVGMWALVGSSFPATVYVCSTAGAWSASELTGGPDDVDLTAYVPKTTYDAEIATLVPKSDIVDNTTTDDATKVLSAKQGKVVAHEISPMLEETSYSGLSTELVGGYWYLYKSVGETVNSTPNSNPSDPTALGYHQYKCLQIAVNAGDVVTLSSQGRYGAKPWCVIDKDRKVLEISAETSDAVTKTLYITQQGYVLVNCMADPDTITDPINYLTQFSVKRTTNKTVEEIGSLEEESERVKNSLGLKTYDLTYSGITTSSYWLIGSNSTAPDTPSAYSSTQWSCMRIAVKSGQTVTISTKGGNNARAWALTDESRVIYDRASTQADTSSSPVTKEITKDGWCYVNYDTTSGKTFFVKVDIDVPAAISAAQSAMGEGAFYAPHYENNPLPLWKDTLKVLAIGNSYTEDPNAYLRDLITAANISASKLCVYIAIQSSASLETWVNNYDNNTSKSMIRVAGSIVMDNSETGTPPTVTGTLKTLLSKDWDVVVLQQVSSSANSYSSFNPYLTKMIGYIRKNCTNPKVAIAWQSVWSYKSDYSTPGGETRWAAICKATKEMCHKDGIDIVIPTGTAIQNARSTNQHDASTNPGVNTNGELTRDGTHLSYGLGRYIAACTWFQTLIAPMFGVGVVGNPAVHECTGGELRTPTSSPANAQGIYEAIDVTNDNKRLCQLCAFAATVNKWEVTEIANDTSIADYSMTFPATIFDRVSTLETTVAGKQATLVSGTNIKTINNESLLGSGNITITGGSGGSSVQSDWSQTDNTQADYIKNKPTLATVATSGSYSDLSNKPTIPDAQIQSDWNQTSSSAKDYIKNKPTIPDVSGLYTKPSGGIPSSDLASAVQTSLGKADTALQSFTESDPVFVASAAYGISSSDISNWNAKADKRTVVTTGSALTADTYLELGTTDTVAPTLPATYTDADEFIFSFTCDTSACTVTLPTGVTLADNCDNFSEVAAGVFFQVSIMNDVAAYLCVTPTTP